MMNIKKIMRGLTLLLCLGFFAFATTSNAWAQFRTVCFANNIKSAQEHIARDKKDIERYCTQGSNYNQEKCDDAKDELQEDEEHLQKAQDELVKCKEQVKARKAKISDLISQAKAKGIEAKLIEDELNGLGYFTVNGSSMSLEDAETYIKNYQKGNNSSSSSSSSGSSSGSSSNTSSPTTEKICKDWESFKNSVDYIAMELDSSYASATCDPNTGKFTYGGKTYTKAQWYSLLQAAERAGQQDRAEDSKLFKQALSECEKKNYGNVSADCKETKVDICAREKMQQLCKTSECKEGYDPKNQQRSLQKYCSADEQNAPVTTPASTSPSEGSSTSTPAPTPSNGESSSGGSSSGSSGAPISTKTIDTSKIEKNKTNNLKDLDKDIGKLGFDCVEATNAKNDYSSKADAYKAAAEALNSAIQQVTSACNKYSKMKAEYNSCLSGGKGVDVSSARNAQKAADAAEKAMNNALSSAESSISSCKNSGKDSKKADKAADKAQGKVDDLVKDAKKLGINCDSGQTCIDMLQGAYDNCSDPKLCKKYKKLLDELKEKQGTLDDALKTKEEAEQAKLNSQCKSPWVWNKNANACAPSSSWSKEEYDEYQEFMNECTQKPDGTYYESRCEDLAKKYGKSSSGTGEGGLDANGATLGGDQELADLEAQYDAKIAECQSMPKGEEKKQCYLDAQAIQDQMTLKKCEATPGEEMCGGDLREVNVKPDDGKLHCPRLDEIGTGSDNTIFDYLTCRITDLLIRIRMIVYVLAGFGMIAFAYGAIIGKISFKQLANIGIGLFILSMTTSVIEYVVFPKNSGQHLKYGNYLKDGHTLESVEAERDAIRSRSSSGGSSSAGGMSQSSCEKNPSLCPDSSWLSEKPSSSWSIGDIKNSISSIADAVSTGINTFNTVSHAVSTASSAISKIGDAISGENDATRSAKANLERANENLSYARQDAAAARQAQAMAQEAYDAAQENVNSYNELVSNKKAEMDALSKALKSGDLSAANPETLSAMADAEAKLAEDKARLALLQDVKDLDKLKKSAEAADKKVADIEAQLAALDPEAHPSQKAAYDALQKKLAEAKAAADGLHSRVDAADAEANNPDLDLQSEMASLKTAVADDEYNLNAAKTKAKTEIQDQLAEMKGDLDGLQADLKEAQATANSAKKDLNSANSEAKKAENAVSSAENVVSNCERNLENAKNSVGNFFDRMSQAASNVDKLTTTISNTANTVAKNSSRITNDVVDSTQNSAQREKKDKIKQERNRMEQKCSKNPSKCTSEELDYLAQLQDADDNNTNAVDKYLNSDAPGGGQTILNDLGKASNITGSARNTANAAKSGYNSGKSAGNSVAGKGSALGDVLGVAGGIAKGTTTGVDQKNKLDKSGALDNWDGNDKARERAANQK